MTWSVDHEIQQTHVAGSGVKTDPGRADAIEYHFLTFLPSVGWTVADVSADFGETVDSYYSFEKTVQNAYGETLNLKYIIHIEWAQSDIEAYKWDGTVGGGITFIGGSNNFGPLVSAYNKTTAWRWMRSDESTDLWMLFFNGQVCGHSFPFSSILARPTSSTTLSSIPGLLHQETAFASISQGTLAYQLPFAQSLGGNLLYDNFVGGNVSGSGLFMINRAPDTVHRTKAQKNTTNNVTNATQSNAVVLQFDGKYWVDTDALNGASLLLDCGSTDPGIF